MVDVLEDIGALSYPKWLSDTAPFLPPLDLTCVSKSGIAYLDENNGTDASAFSAVSGFFDAIATGCSSDSFTLSGGYDPTAGELSMNVVVVLGGTRNL